MKKASLNLVFESEYNCEMCDAKMTKKDHDFCDICPKCLDGE